MTLEDYTFQLNSGVLLNSSILLPFVDIDRVVGLDSPPFRETVREHEGQDGGFIDAEFESGRDVILEGTVFADSSTIEDYLDDLKANYGPIRTPVPFVFKAPGVGERVLFVKSRGCRYDWDIARRTGKTPIQFLMYAEDPRIYDNSLLNSITNFGGLATTGFGFTNILDTFSTSAVDTWSTTDTGQTWTRQGGVDADFDKAGGIGTASAGAVNDLKGQLVNLGTPNQTVTTETMLQIGNANSASATAWLVARYADSSNYYIAILELTTTGNINLLLQKRVAGAISTIGGPTTIGTGHVGGDWWHIKLEVLTNAFLATNLVRAKIWKRGDVEPAYTFDATDSSLAAGNSAGTLSRLETGNTNSLPVVFAFDNFQQPFGFGFNLDFGVAVPPTGIIVVNGGNRPTPPVFTITGPTVDPRIINVTDSKSLNFVITLGALDTLVVDTANRTVTLNGTTNRRDALQTLDWFFLNPGSTEIRFGGGSGSGQLLVTYRNAWR